MPTLFVQWNIEDITRRCAVIFLVVVKEWRKGVCCHGSITYIGSAIAGPIQW